MTVHFNFKIVPKELIRPGRLFDMGRDGRCPDAPVPPPPSGAPGPTPATTRCSSLSGLRRPKQVEHRCDPPTSQRCSTPHVRRAAA
jgi:hypothetical protein